MENTDLFGFVAEKLSDRRMKMTELHQRCGVGRTMLYRYLQGSIPMPEDLPGKLAEALGLSGQDKRTLEALAALALVDKTMVEARQVIEDRLFSGNAPADSFELVLYDNDRFLRTAQEAFDMLRAELKRPGVCCQIKVHGCMEAPFAQLVSTLLEEALSLNAGHNVEHYFSMPGANYAYRMQCFCNTLRLLPKDGYRAYVQEIPQARVLPHSFMKDFMLLSVLEPEHGQTPQKSDVFVLLPDGLSQCYVGHDVSRVRLVEEAFASCRVSHLATNMATANETYDVQSELMMKVEDKYPSYILKPDCCYHEAPPAVFESMIGRLSGNLTVMEDLVAELTGTTGDTAQSLYIVQKTINDLAVRHGFTKKIAVTGVHTAEGLRELAKTGRLSDHIKGLPELSPEERALLFDYLCGRMLDKKDPYRLYISNRDIVKDVFIAIFKDYGVCVELLGENQTVDWAYMLRDIKLAEALVDYIENVHIPKNCMSQAEAADFIGSLMDRQ